MAIKKGSKEIHSFLYPEEVVALDEIAQARRLSRSQLIAHTLIELIKREQLKVEQVTKAVRAA